MHKLLFASLFVAVSALCSHAQTAKWERTNGPFGGGAEFLWQMGNVVFSGSQGGAIYKSYDTGKSWIRNGTLNDGGVAVSDSSLFEGFYPGLARSTDSGLIWTPIPYDTEYSGIQRIVANDSTLFYLSSALLRSTNLGKSWVVISGVPFPGSICFVGSTIYIISNPSYAGQIGGVYRSTNNGTSWKHLDTTFAYRPETLVSVGESLFAFSNNGFLYLSDDSAVNWTLQSSSFPTDGMTMCSLGSDLFVETFGHGIYRSEDGGITWLKSSNGISDSYINALASFDGVLFAATQEAVYRSTDEGETWLLTDSGIDAATNLIASDGKVLLASINNGVFRSPDDGLSWQQANGYVGSSVAFSFALRDTTWFTTTDESYVTDVMVLNKSLDGGVNWDSCGILADDELVVANNAGLIFGGGWAGGGLYRTMGDGNGWTVLDSDAFIYGWETVSRLALCDSLVVAIRNTEDSIQLIVSPDFGDTWQLGNIVDSGIYSIGVAGRAILTGTLMGIYRSTDLGLTWTQVSTYKNAGIMVTKDSVTLASSINGGIILSLDYGLHWQVFNDGLPSLDISALAIGSGEIYAALSSGGIFYSNIPEFSGVSSAPQIGSSGQLDIYPNPVSSLSTIEYPLDQGAPVTLTVFDPLGREVMRPISAVWQDAGEHIATIDIHGLTPGMYECRLNTGDAVMTAKMVVAK